MKSYSKGRLSELIPLDTPAVLAIEISSRCCFTCNYCYQAFLNEKDRFNTDMTLDSFKNVIDGTLDFPGEIDTLVLARFGEPLMNRDVVQMVQYAKECPKISKVKLITNGYLLTDNLFDELTEAGLDSMVLSMQGTNSADYKSVTGVDLDFITFFNGIKNFSKRRNGMSLTLKFFSDTTILDKEVIHEALNIADDVIFENIIDLDNSSKEYVKKYGMNRKICPQPFFTVNIDAKGNYIPCCGDVYGKLSTKNISDISVYEYWNSKDLNHIQLGILKKEDNIFRICQECKGADIYTSPDCNLDGEQKNILCKLERKEVEF